MDTTRWRRIEELFHASLHNHLHVLGIKFMALLVDGYASFGLFDGAQIGMLQFDGLGNVQISFEPNGQIVGNMPGPNRQHTGIQHVALFVNS